MRRRAGGDGKGARRARGGENRGGREGRRRGEEAREKSELGGGRATASKGDEGAKGGNKET